MTLLRQRDLSLWRLASSLLERMEYVHRLLELGDVEDAMLDAGVHANLDDAWPQ